MMILYLENLWGLFVDMSFYIVIGLIFTGLLHAFVKKDIILKQIGKNTTSSVVKASVFGVPLPLCSCGVVPTAMYLGKSGASKGAVVSFLTSTPQTGVDSLIATYGMMGPIFAVYRAIAAFISGIVSGVVTNVLCKHDTINYHSDSKTCCSGGIEEVVEEHSCCCGSKEEVVEEHTCCCGNKEEVVEEHSCCCGSKQEEVVEEHSCCCGSKQEEVVEEHTCCCGNKQEVVEEYSCCSSTKEVSKSSTFVGKLVDAMKYAFGEFLDEIIVHFIVGLLIAALISTVLPASLLSSLSNPLITMILMVVIGIPMYICSTASIPIAVSLMMKGVTPGGAFVFLFAGPVTNIASLTILLNTLGKKVTTIYLTCVGVCAIGFGLLFDILLDAFGYTGIMDVIHCSQGHGSSMFQMAVAIGFGILLVIRLIKKYTSKSSHGCACQG